MKALLPTAIKFGLIGSGVHLFIFLVYFFTGANPMIEMYIIDIFILPVFLYFGIREFRDVQNGRLLKFWEGMTSGLIQYMLIATVTAVFTWVFLEFIDTSLLENYIQHSISDLTENEEKLIDELGKTAYHDSISQTKATTAGILALDNFIKRVAMGFLLTSAISTMMKKTEG